MRRVQLAACQRHWIGILPAVLIAGALLLAGCTLQAQPDPPAPLPAGAADVPFTSLLQDELGMGHSLAQDYYEPRVALLTTLEEAEALAPLLSPAAQAAAGWVDYTRYAVLTVLRGHRPSLNFPVIIDRVALTDGRLLVQAQFWEPRPSQASGAAITYPAHLVLIERAQLPATKLPVLLQPYRVVMGYDSPSEPGRSAVPFTTAVLDDAGTGTVPAGAGEGPQLRLLTSAAELAAVAGAGEPLESEAFINWDQDALIGLWRGPQAGCNFRAEINWLIRIGDQLRVYATFWTPPPAEANCGTVTHPYHLVTVNRLQATAGEPVLALQLRERAGMPPLIPLALPYFPAAIPPGPPEPLPPRALPVPFTTLLQGALDATLPLQQDYTGPRALLVRTHAQAAAMASLLPPAAQAAAAGVDYSRDALLILLRGYQGRNAYPVVIERVALYGDQLLVQAQFWEPEPGQETGTALTYPLHLVLIEQDLLPSTLPQVLVLPYSMVGRPPAPVYPPPAMLDPALVSPLVTPIR
jgi:hypothetical protein